MNKMILAAALLSSASVMTAPRDASVCNAEEEITRTIMLEEDTAIEPAILATKKNCKSCTCVDCKCTAENKCSEDCDCFLTKTSDDTVLPTVAVTADNTN